MAQRRRRRSLGMPVGAIPALVHRLGRAVFATACMVSFLAAGATAQAAGAEPVPYPPSAISAEWIGPRYQSGSNQTGDILPISWSNDGTFAMVNDGSVEGRAGRNVLAKVLGRPPNLHFRLVGRPDQLQGHLYSNGFTSVNGIFYATQLRIWHWWTDSSFKGLWGIAYSLNHGSTWRFPDRPFPWWMGDTNFVQEGRNSPNADGKIYAIANGREFNATHIWLGSTYPGPKNVTTITHWHWRVHPIIAWPGHITYPRMTYDPQLGRYLLSFSYSYFNTIPQIWKGGAQLVVLEAPRPWGPFRLLFQQGDWGPSNGYGGTFPIAWQEPLVPSGNGQYTQNLWMDWAANYTGCELGLECTGKYGMNTQELRLTVPAAVLSKSRRGN